MPGLSAYLEAMRHSHHWLPFTRTEGDVLLERCACGAVRPAPEPDDDDDDQ